MSKCDTCKFWRSINGSGTERLHVCHYIIDYGISRGCKPGDECTRYEERTEEYADEFKNIRKTKRDW